MAAKTTPVVVILATGGTIAGQAASQAKSLDYVSGVVAVDELLQAVPGVEAIAGIRCAQVANIGSEDMTDAVWLKLAESVNKCVADPDVAGVVVLHGTDTMEETAYFLDLVTDGGKPVVLTGSMRPANAVAADGPANILNAVALAASPEVGENGVLVCFNDGIFAAREVTKIDSVNLAAFGSPKLGELGFMAGGKPSFYRSPIRRAAERVFALDGIEELPRVEILYGHAGQRRDLVDAAVAAGARGIVHAGVGMGMVHREARPALVAAAKKGVAVVCSSRVAAALVPACETLARDGLIAADNLNPQKARVLLQLALTVTSDPGRLQSFFDIC